MPAISALFDHPQRKHPIKSHHLALADGTLVDKRSTRSSASFLPAAFEMKLSGRSQ